MIKYYVDGDKFNSWDEAFQFAEDDFWNCGGFEAFWANKVDALQVFEELGRLSSPLYYELYDAICDKLGEAIDEVEEEDEED